MCRSDQKQNKEVTLIEAEDYVIESIQIHENTTPNEAEALVILTILEEKVLVKLDTGAEVNVMRIWVYVMYVYHMKMDPKAVL